MPESTHRAVMAFATPGRTSRPGAMLRVAIGIALALSLLVVPELTSPEPVAAAATCTGWTSQAAPPRTIRVLRTHSGRIETVDFRRYVATVMASGEWPGNLKTATLEAGAVATKQYAWFYVMKGHHRPGYVRGNTCYDVRDDTNDQLYRPESAKPTARQEAALERTWNLTLRKLGRFFLTGHRNGVTTTCAADANGWKLYARSMQACAHKGWSSKRILNRYLSPNLKFVWSDKTGPAMRKPRIALEVGNTIVDGAATVSWRPRAKGSHVSAFRLQRKVAGGSWKKVPLSRATARKVDARVKIGAKNRFRVRARDSKGNWGPWSSSPRRKAVVRGPVGQTLARDVFEAADRDPVKVRARFTGRSVGLVTRTGPGMGQVMVFIDGKRVATVDLERATATQKKMVWTKNWAHSASHSISVKVVNSHRRVDFNGFFVLR